MDRRVGVWVDHRKAVIVSLDETQVSSKTLLSNVGPRVRMSGGSRSKTAYGPQDEAPEGKRDRRYSQALDRYYDEVIAELQGAAAVCIMGPGEARTELEARIRKRAARLAAKICSIEPADKMTERQIVSRTRERFAAPVR